jgi:hypothetical protein
MARLARPTRRSWRATLFPALRLGAWATVGLVPVAAAVLALEPKTPPTDPTTPFKVEEALTSKGRWGSDTSMPGIELSYLGTGTVGGSSGSPEIAWDSGTIHVEVTPNQGLHLAVRTREAEVRVIGTGFTVTRNALGTHVEVRHGIVEVDCGDEGTVRLTVGEERTCLPRTAAGLLGRARALREASAPEGEVLESLDRGLAEADVQDAVRDELQSSRIRSLFALGRRTEVLDAARGYLAREKSVRRTEVERLAVATARAEGGCEAAAPWLPATSATAAAACAAP